MTNNNRWFNLKYILFYIISALCGILNSQAQNTEVQLANQYLSNGEKEKAYTAYKELARDQNNIRYIHNNFFNLLLEMKKNKEAESYLENVIRWFNKDTYHIDLGYLYMISGQQEKGEKYLTTYILTKVRDVGGIQEIARELVNRNLNDLAIMAFTKCRAEVKSPNLFVFDLANIHRRKGNFEAMAEEYLRYVDNVKQNLEYAQNLMQNLVATPEEQAALENILYQKIQTNPESMEFAHLLIWINIQQKDFGEAIIQAKAFDRRFPGSDRVLKLGYIALNNEDYEIARLAFEHVLKNDSKNASRLSAQAGLIKAKEQKLKKSYPVDNNEVRKIVSDYQKFINENPHESESYEAMIAKAGLYAYYLNEQDSSVAELQNVIRVDRVSGSVKAKAKIELSDIYLIKGEPWESTLLLSQVEKTQKEGPLAFEAKLKNAKLWYYKGEFQLAQEHLDILKKATTREIANDALNLSFFIKENLRGDSTGADLKEYAKIDLLLQLNRIQEAIDKIEAWKKSKAGQKVEIMDDFLWLEGNLKMKAGEFEKAVSLFEEVMKTEGSIFADDALFMQAKIYDKYLNNKELALQKYNEIMTRFGGSEYVAQARKRYRILRGDTISSP